MPRASVSTGLELEYDTIGSPDDPALLLVMGFAAQMTAWPDALCKMLADTGLFVIRFDNRDCGLSSKFDGITVDIMTILGGGEAADAVEVPYTLSDMAADAVGLLDHLGIDSAHIMGASMGGMIAQTIAIEHPQRVRSLISVMSTTGDPAVGQPSPEAWAALLTPPPTDRAGFIEAAPRYMVFHSKKYRDAELTKERAAVAYDRSFYPEGAPRQLGAVRRSGNWSEKLTSVEAPTLVIHGRDDTLVDPSGGIQTAQLIPNASLLLLADMGHDLPEPLWPTIVSAIDNQIKIAS
jgi:pimeloyl-ACP methyl ester carboxylesterase